MSNIAEIKNTIAAYKADYLKATEELRNLKEQNIYSESFKEHTRMGIFHRYNEKFDAYKVRISDLCSRAAEDMEKERKENLAKKFANADRAAFALKAIEIGALKASDISDLAAAFEGDFVTLNILRNALFKSGNSDYMTAALSIPHDMTDEKRNILDKINTVVTAISPAEGIDATGADMRQMLYGSGIVFDELAELAASFEEL